MQHCVVCRFRACVAETVLLIDAEQLTTGGNASIECMAFGDPLPQVSWFKDSRRLHNESIKLVVVDKPDVSDGRYVISHVLLRHVTDADAGDYK